MKIIDTRLFIRIFSDILSDFWGTLFGSQIGGGCLYVHVWLYFSEILVTILVTFFVITASTVSWLRSVAQNILGCHKGGKYRRLIMAWFLTGEQDLFLWNLRRIKHPKSLQFASLIIHSCWAHSQVLSKIKVAPYVASQRQYYWEFLAQAVFGHHLVLILPEWTHQLSDKTRHFSVYTYYCHVLL